MNIYGDVRSPFVRMVLMTAHELGLSTMVELVAESAHMAEENPRLAGLSPIGKIPILETNHGDAVYDSRVIMEYFAHHTGDKKLFPEDGVKRFRILTLLALAQGLAEAAVALRYETAVRPEQYRWPDMQNRNKQRIMAAVADAEQNWQAELAEVNAGSIAMASALGYIDFRHPGLDWRQARPGLHQFLDGFSKRDSMKRTQPS